MHVVINKVYSFKLNSGEEIIALVTGVVSDHPSPHYVVEAPLGTAMSQQGMQLMPAMFTTDLNNKASIYFSSVAMISEPRTDITDAYRESTTGITVPDKQIILG